MSDILSISKQETRVITVGIVGPMGPQGPRGMDGTSGSSRTFTVQNSDASVVKRGVPLALVSDGVVRKANASLGDKCFAVVATDPILSGGFGLAMDMGVITCTIPEWDQVTEVTGGLIPGATYYLSQTAGLITNVPNLASGSLVIVGFASSSTELRLALGNKLIL